MSYIPPAHSVIFRTGHWIVNHNLDIKIPGYLMLSTGSGASEFHTLPADALVEMGPLIAKVTAAIKRCFDPRYLFVSRYGVTPGHALHFHLVPVYPWIERMLEEHPRYEYLKSLYRPELGFKPDAADFTLFIWREFAEAKEPLAAEGFSLEETVERLREELARGVLT